MTEDVRNRIGGEWERSKIMRARIQYDPLFEGPVYPNGPSTYAGRPIITRDTPINGGVYLGAGQREAIVVDDRAYPEELQEAYMRTLRRMGNPRRSQYDSLGYCQAAFGEAHTLLGGSYYSPNTINRIVDRYVTSLNEKHKQQGNPGDVRIALNSFINLHAGLCRHRALLTGYLLERMVSEGKLSGEVSIDRNTVKGRGGHAWVRFTEREEDPNNIAIIDPSLHFVGPLSEAPLRLWDYRRPEDCK